MVFAKTSKAAARLTEQMRTGDFEKRYLAVLGGTLEPESGKLEGWLKKNTINNMVYLCTEGTDGAKYAALDYRVLEKRGGLSLTDIKLHTGRSHQIRVQFAGIAHPSTAICATAANMPSRESSRCGRILLRSPILSPRSGCASCPDLRRTSPRGSTSISPRQSIPHNTQKWKCVNGRAGRLIYGQFRIRRVESG